ncbi:hypothetical protein A5634_10630 [Mycobacterium asiaticum]|uniref:Twin-arginine translocation pathway signal n=2 Tax=Mycobacterium asiaticum TaxID=1790 RepID=A0A1A3NGL2_MYCAS|nr:hypothetical protein A5634_10630 [Mycobacterium asiaticum]
MAATPAAASVGAWQLVVKSRQPPAIADQAAARQTVIDAASDGTVKVLSYSPDTLDRDFAAARACLTGDFLGFYDEFTRQIVEPAARARALTTTAKVQRAGVETLTSSEATILVFVDQTTTTNDAADPRSTSSSVRVNLTRVKGTWLINQFKPV